MNYFAFWYLVGAAAIWFIGFETKGRTIRDIDGQLTGGDVPPEFAKATAGN